MGLQLYIMQPDISRSCCGSQIGEGLAVPEGLSLRVGWGCPSGPGMGVPRAELSGQPQPEGGRVEGQLDLGLDPPERKSVPPFPRLWLPAHGSGGFSGLVNLRLHR